MSLPEKIETIKKYIDGSRSVTDLAMFWHRPRAWVGGEWLNRAGYQPLRCLYQNMTHRPSLTGIPPELIDRAKILIDEGVVLIENLLPDDVFCDVRDEFFRALDPDENSASTATKNGVRSTSGVFTKERFPITAEHLVNNERIWSLVSAAVGKKLKYQPGTYFHSETMDDEAIQDTDHNIVLHEDVYYPTFKAFFLINRNDPSNGSYVSVPRSHRFNLKRLKHEYLYSIDVARQKKGKSVSFPVHENGRLEIFGPVYAKEDLREVQITGEPNTLIIANTMGFHRRGGSVHGKARQQVRMSFRCVETLHHKLYPLFGTKGSRRLKEVNYY